MRPFARVRRQIASARDNVTRTDGVLERLAHRVASDLDNGQSSSSSETSGRRGSDANDPTMRAALARRADPIARQVGRFLRAVDNAERANRELWLAAQDLIGLDRADAQRIAAEVNASTATCSVCSRLVLQTRSDRLRSSRCEACYRYWTTHVDQHGHRVDRPSDLWDTDLWADESGGEAAAQAT